MKEWSTGKKRVVGVVATVVVVYLLYLGATWLWDVVREMHHM